MNLNQLYTLVEDIAGEIKVPDTLGAYERAIWIEGRNVGIKHGRAHVRHNVTQAMPHLKTAPKNVVKFLGGEKIAKIWLAGYETAINHIEAKINAAIFSVTRGAVIQAIGTK